ncbi:MAG: alpha/beta hydrolase [Myxococcota bacterium]|nr:alpha/beta hydrolase [Myxococcota bacterium]
MPVANINGHQIHYETHGEGAPLLLIHSFLCNTDMWRPQIEHLAKNHRVIAMDIRGHGQSGPSKPHSLYDLVDDALGVLDAEGVQRAVWLGLSIGGMISMRAALRAPDRVNGMVLLATDAKAESLLVKLERRVLAQVVRHIGVLPVIVPVLRKMFGARAHKKQRALIKTWKQRFLAVHTDSMLESLQALLLRDDVSKKLRTVRVPTLIMHGTQDRAIKVSLAKNTKKHLGQQADLRILKGVGHLMTLEDPEEVNIQISYFLSRLNLNPETATEAS